MSRQFGGSRLVARLVVACRDWSWYTPPESEVWARHAWSEAVVETTLRGWKEIAVFLGTSPRSAQRWERELGMPVHRLRMTTGSVVTAYPSELDAWRRGISSDLVSDLTQGDRADEPADDFGTPAVVPSGNVSGPAEGQKRARYGRAEAFTVRIAAGFLLGGAVLAGGWLWLQQPGRTDRGVVARTTAGSGLRVTSGSSTVRLQPGADGLATLTLPGFPELQVLTVPSGSEMTVELSRNGGSPERVFRIAQLRLTREIPANLRMANGTSVTFAWEDSPAPTR
jgi:hypothetical protein